MNEPVRNGEASRRTVKLRGLIWLIVHCTLYIASTHVYTLQFNYSQFPIMYLKYN